MFHMPKSDNPQRIIIFDSPDGTGKTNIAYALATKLGIPYFKMTTEHENWRKGKFKEALEFDQTYILQFLKQTGYSVVIDRAYPAEWVYSKVYKRETNDELLVKLDHGFADLGANIIIPVREDYSNNRPDELVSKTALPELHQKYMEFRDFSRCKTITIYVDSYKENLQMELDALIPELDFGKFSYNTFDVVLHRTVRNKFSDEEIKANAPSLENINFDHLGRQRLKRG